ncbi:precorrin-3B C(17)-methyltransferase [Porphyromonas crevioricanis]|nr:precorrin-3B C(17)-methyltransferase [Porphyromonas crevioricanis]
MIMSKILVVGLGPGGVEDMTPAVMQAIAEADVVIGYKYYFRFVQQHLKSSGECIDTGMKKERERARIALEKAREGKKVCVISSGDSGIYGMAPLMYEMREEMDCQVEIETLPGISAFQKAAALLGAPIGHDLCLISLSDLLTPWLTIEKRIKAAAEADFVTCIYNPKSHDRYWQFYRLQEIFLTSRSASTPVGYVRQAGREEETVVLTTLGELDPEELDMFTVVIIGNSQTYASSGKMITPRGYFAQQSKTESKGIGQDIMIKSFRTIEAELKDPNIPIDRKWPLLHCIHTTADFAMEDVLYTDPGAVEHLYRGFSDGTIKHIVTDVSMVQSGIRKGALDRLGVQVHCYLSDPAVKEMAESEGITRTQAGIRLAVQEHPDALFVFGNAPTALIELCTIIRKGKAKPAGIVAAPVGFVHVCESKYMCKTFRDVPKVIVEGRKGGSNLAATIVNSILCFDDAEALRPGRDV